MSSTNPGGGGGGGEGAVGGGEGDGSGGGDGVFSDFDSDVLLAQTSIGQVSRVDVSSKVEVVWADNSMTIVLPQVSQSKQKQPTRSAWCGCS